MGLLQTSLHEQHLALNAKMAPFAGFDMPLQYSSVKEEVLAVRNGAGIFDVSHMGEFFVSGSDATRFIDYLITNDYAGSPVGKAVYSPLCRDNGTCIDDLIAYKIRDDLSLICVNASNIDKDWNWISSHADKFDVELTNRSKDYSLLALQGPKSAELMSKLDLNIQDLPYYGVQEMGELIIARTGYTGEDGFELFCSHQKAQELWKSLINLGAAPCGLAARDVLRLEVCFPLYGHEIHDEVTPLDSALKWTVKMAKEDFVGKSALASYQPRYKLIKIMLERGIPREGYKLVDSDNKEIGIVTSGTMSVVLGKGVALAHLNVDASTDNINVLIRDKLYPATTMKGAFVKGGHK